MAASDDPVAEYLAKAAELLELPILPEHYEEVLAAFRALRGQASLVTDFALPRDVEAAPRYSP